MRNLIWMLTILTIASPQAATAKEKARAPQFQQLIDCKTVAEPTERLACYDRAVAAIDTAERNKELVVVDKEQVRKARRTLFGLPLPRIDLLSGETNADELSQIEGKVASARENFEGWRITLDDGSTWQQTDSRAFFRDPKPGDAVVVSRATLGSYFLKIGNIPPVKVKRLL